ncbi:MAG: DUF6879 family protein [Nanoarchaeota archaeon]
MKDHFSNFKKYAFRLELLQKYTVKEEEELFKHFLKTGETKEEGREDWVEIIKSAVQRGAVMERVHVIKQPLSDYLKFELEAYKLNIKNGEKISLLSQEDFNKIKTNINSDFWLFDDKIVLKMSYDKEGRFLGFNEIRDNIGEFIELKDKLLMQAKRLEDLEKI